MSLIEIDWKPDAKKLGHFGVLLGTLLLASAGVGFVGLFRPLDVQPAVFLVPGLLIATLALVRPGWLRPLYLIWMGLAFPLGWALSHLLLALLYYGILTVTGLLLRVFSGDRLGLRRLPADHSYWVPRAPPRRARQYFRQF